MDEIKAGENRPSEVFLALWYFRANREPLSAENFKLCAETWLRLRAAEAKEADDNYRAFFRAMSGIPKAPEKAPVFSEACPDRTPEEDPSPAPQDDKADEDAELEARKAEEAAKVRSDAGAKGLATRKRNVRAALEELRASGVKLQEIADADQRLSINDVLQMLEAKPVSLPVLSALERAVSALRARDAGPSEEDMS